MIDCRHLPRPPASNTPALGQGDLSNHVSGDAIVALLHASNTLTGLKTLDLVESPVAAANVGTFCDALVSFAGSLTALHVDEWPAQDTSTNPPTAYVQPVRQQVVASIAKLKLLKRLSIRDWSNLVGDDCCGGRVQGNLKCLEEIAVGDSYPCKQCPVGECVHFEDTLPFKAADE